MRPVLVPPPLRPRDRVRVVAPSGPFNRTLLWRGLGWLSERYQVTFSRRIFEREGYLAGEDSERLADLQEALVSPDVRAVIAARGGYGSGRIAHRIDLTPLFTEPKWLVGFSDITALHVEAVANGLVTLHAHNAAGLGRGDAAGRSAWQYALESPQAPREIAGLECWSRGKAQGMLVGGNLTVLAACATSGRLRLPRGCVLFIEDVGEAPYRLDRTLTSLAVGGHLDRVGGVVCGDFTDCDPGRHGVDVRSAIRRSLCPLGIPIAAGLEAGHGRHNTPLHLGYVASLDANRGRLTLEPPGGKKP